MKRSKMLDHLYDTLESDWGYDFNLSYRNLDYILEILEKAGMVPPHTLTNDPKFSEYGVILTNPDMPYIKHYHTWEPEND